MNNNNNNQGNYQQYRACLPPPPSFQQAGANPYGAPVSVPPSGSWSQRQNILPPIHSLGHLQVPRIPPPGHHYYRVPPPLLPPQPSSSYFTPVVSGSFAPPPPPPPPPSSPPPGTPPLPVSSPPCDGDSLVNGSETSVKDTSDFNSLSDTPPPLPRDEETVRKIEVLCQYIAKNGQDFEEMTCQKEVGNPDFEFLFGGAPGSEAAISHEYFKWMKRKCRSNVLVEGGDNRDLSLKPSVVGELHEDISHSPAGSDMDMEDDITHPEEPGSRGKSFGNEKHDIKAENNACESPRAIEQVGPNLSHNDTEFGTSKMKVGVDDSELALDCKTEHKLQDDVNLHQEMNQSEQSPFRLIQGYASDISSENDNDPHFENVSPVAVSPQVKEHTTLSVPVVEGSLSITSKDLESFIETEKVENRTDGGASIKQDNRLKGDDTTGPKNGGDQEEDNDVKLEVDEFGRMVKKGGSGSDSDDYSTRRRIKRRRSRSRSRSSYRRSRSRSPYRRSRSRSPYGRRRRSPQRRGDKRSPSRSWSPKERGRSRSPHNRRNRSDLQEFCYDFSRGRCYRGATCRYLHKPQKSETSKWHKNKQNYNKPLGHSAEVGSGREIEHPATEMAITAQIPISGHPLNQTSQPRPQPANEYNLMPQITLSNSLPPPPANLSNTLPPPPAALSNSLPPPPATLSNFLPPPPATLSNSLPPPPATLSNSLQPPLQLPQLGRPVPQYQLNQPPFQTNYSLQPFVTSYRPEITTQLGAYPMNSPILQQLVAPTIINQDNFARTLTPNLVSSNSREPPAGINAIQSFLQNAVADSISDFGRSKILSHYNPYASTFDQPLSTKFSSGVFNQDYGPSSNQNHTPVEGQTLNLARNPPMCGGDQYDPLFDSIDPSSNSFKKNDVIAASEENDEFGETAEAEVGAVENYSPSPSSPPIDLPDMATGEIEIDQVKNKKSKDSRSMKLFKIAIADFVKEVLKPSWRQGNMSKEAFKTIVKKTVDKVSGAIKKHQIPKSQTKIDHYIDSSQRKLTKLVMGYVDKYVKV